MTGPNFTSRSRRAGLLLASLVVITSLAFVLVKALSPDHPSLPLMTESPRSTAPLRDQAAPTAATTRVHQALHALGRICKPNDTTNQTSQARRPVAVILDFARRYPKTTFHIDDETGTAISLLIVVRQSLRSCAPSLMSRVNRALPSQYQTSSNTS